MKGILALRGGSHLLVPVKATAHVPVGTVSCSWKTTLRPASDAFFSNSLPYSSLPIQPMKVLASGT